MNRNKKILIIGSSGQLGSEFSSILKTKDIALIAPPEQSLDLTNKGQIINTIRESKPGIIINCAAYNAVDDAEDNPEIAELINHKAVADLAEICNDFSIKLVHFGSDYVFDGRKGDFYCEDDPVNPLNIYGKSKYAGEQAVLQCNTNNLVFRLSWVFGIGAQNFLYKLTNWAKNNRVLKITADEVSVPTYTNDIVTFVLKCIDKGMNGLYHLTNSGYASRYELARFFIENMQYKNLVVPVSISYFQTKATRPLFSPMSNEKLTQELQETIPSWENSVERFIKVFNKVTF